MKLFLTNPITGPIGTEGVAPIDEAISVERILEIRYEITTKITLPSNYGKIIKTIKLYAQEAENSSKKIKIIMQVTDNAAIDTIEKDYIKYIVYCFCKYLGISRADFCKIVEINYIASNTTNQATQKNQTNGKGQQGELFNKKDLHNEKYIQAGPIIPHNNNKDAVHLMTKWIESVLGFGATNHVLLIGPESSGKKALAHRSIGKVVSIAPNLKITEISLISLQTKWNDICKQNYAQTNQNNNLFKEFNDQFKDTDILMLHLDKVVLSDKLTDRLKGMLSNTGMKCIFIAESLGLSQIQKMIAPDIQAQPAYLSQPEPKYRAKILTGMLKQNEITNIDEKIINTIALRTHSTNDFPQIIKTIKDHITESKPINHETIITYLEKIFVMSYPSYTLDNLQKRIQEYILDNEVSISDHDVTMRLAYFASKLPKGGTENEPSRFTEDDIALRSDKPGSAIKKYIKNGMNNSNTALKIALEKYIKNKLEEKLIIFDATWI